MTKFNTSQSFQLLMWVIKITILLFLGAYGYGDNGEETILYYYGIVSYLSFKINLWFEFMQCSSWF